MHCSALDKDFICNNPDPIFINLAFTHCRKFCGLCDCYDDETENFKCTDLDHYNFCIDIDSLAYAVARKKCRKYCGFCGPQTTILAQITDKATTEMPTTTAKTGTQTTKQGATIIFYVVLEYMYKANV